MASCVYHHGISIIEEICGVGVKTQEIEVSESGVLGTDSTALLLWSLGLIDLVGTIKGLVWWWWWPLPGELKLCTDASL